MFFLSKNNAVIFSYKRYLLYDEMIFDLISVYWKFMLRFYKIVLLKTLLNFIVIV